MSTIPVSAPSLSDLETRELIQKAQNGDLTAREKVFIAYMPLAQSYALDYQGLGVPYDDLYQEACYGLLIAIDHYDFNRKEVFATLAKHYITKSIRDNAIQKQNSNLPSCYNRDFYYELKAYIVAVGNLKDSLGREPSNEELSKFLDISLFRARRLKLASEAFLVSVPDFDYSNYTPDITERPVEDEVLRKENYFDISDLQMTLTPREIEVLERRFGFTESQEPETWVQMSAEMGLHIETLRLAYQVAIAKFRRAMGVTPKKDP